MHPFKQLLRQPLRTVAALVILTASAAFMCLSWGVYRSGLTTAKAVDDGFTTLMLYDTEYLKNNKTTRELNMYDSETGKSAPTEMEIPLSSALAIDGTFDEIMSALPQSDSLRNIDVSRYINAYIPGYKPTVPSLEGYYTYYYDAPYNSAVLVFKATDVKIEPNKYMESYLRFSLEGDIIARPAFCDHYAEIDKIRLSYNSTNEMELEEIKSGYEAGKTYIVSLPTSYSDLDRQAKQEIINMRIGMSHGAPTGATVETVDWSKLEFDSDKKPTSWVLGESIDATLEYNGQIYGLSNRFFDGFGFCGSDFFHFPREDVGSDSIIANYYGNLAEVPGTLEDFLVDPENKSWVDQINEINKTLNAVTVYGTDSINSLLYSPTKQCI